MANTLPTDSNGILYEGLRDPSGSQFVAKHATNVATDGGGVKYGDEVVSVTGLVPASGNTALSSPPTNTNAGSDTSLTFSATVSHWTMQNKSSADLYYNLDAAASTSTLVLAPGAQTWWDWPVTVVHVFTAAAIPVNGVNGLVLLGRA